MRLKRKAEVTLKRPVCDEITKDGGEWGAPRRDGGTHKGLDFKARWGHKVYASDDGVVVFSGMIEKEAGRKGSYGKTVVIDHTPMAKENQRHIYTVYAHLDEILVFVGSGKKATKVDAGDPIGKSGNSGTSEHYEGELKNITKGKRGGFHLHFEVIDTKYSRAVMDWKKNKLPSGHRQDPSGYFGVTKKIEYPLTEEEKKKVRNSIKVRSRIDLKRGRWEADVYLGKSKLGRLDKFKSEVKFSVTGKELDEILKNPLRPPGGVSGNTDFELKPG